MSNFMMSMTKGQTSQEFACQIQLTQTSYLGGLYCTSQSKKYFLSASQYKVKGFNYGWFTWEDMRKLGSHQDVMVGIFSIECLESESCAALSLFLIPKSKLLFSEKHIEGRIIQKLISQKLFSQMRKHLFEHSDFAFGTLVSAILVSR